MADSTTNKSISEFEARRVGYCDRIPIRGFWSGADYLSSPGCFGCACVRRIIVKEVDMVSTVMEDDIVLDMDYCVDFIRAFAYGTNTYNWVAAA